jgi:HEAT repeat protein
LAEELWDKFGFEMGMDYSGIFDSLCHPNYNVRAASAEALAAVLDENPGTMQVSLLLFHFIEILNLIFLVRVL